MAKKKIKNIEYFCSFCSAVKKMELQPEPKPGTDDIYWAKCKSCKQMMTVNFNELSKDSKPSLKDFDNLNFIDYSPKIDFEIGNGVYHKIWDDYGVVIEKDVVAKDRFTITVDFQKSGKKKLITLLSN